MLDRIVRLPGMKGTVYALLGKVSEQSGYLFIYDSKVIHNDSVVRVVKQECSVRQAIHRITGSRNLELKVLGNHILITRAAERKSMEETVPLPPRPAYSTIAGILLDKETESLSSVRRSSHKEPHWVTLPTRTVNSGSTCPTR